MPPPNFAASLVDNFRQSRSVATLSLDTIADAELNSAAMSVFAEISLGKLKPIVAEIMTLEDAGHAHALIANGGVHGKIILRP